MHNQRQQRSPLTLRRWCLITLGAIMKNKFNLFHTIQAVIGVIFAVFIAYCAYDNFRDGRPDLTPGRIMLAITLIVYSISQLWIDLTPLIAPVLA